MATQRAHCFDVLRHAVAPRRALSVSQWADDHRVLSTKQSSESGRFRTARTPFLREIMDSLSSQSTVTDVVVMKSSQVGVTECTVNWLGYIMDHSPAPAMVLMPTLESRDAWKAQKLNPLLTDTPRIRDLIGGLRARDATNRQDMIDYPGGVLFLAGGNSVNSYAQRSVRYLVMDDLDRFPVEVGEEGDVVTLARGRTKAFGRPKRLLISTPTVKGESLIEREWERSDQRRYHVPCPHCSTMQPLEWGHESAHGIKWSDGAIDAWYVCRACGAEIREHSKPRMLAAGQWIAAYPDRSIRGYHLTALLAPIGLGPSWRDLAEEWLHARTSPATMRSFINTHLAELWSEQGEEADALGLMARLEVYPDVIPSRARTAGVDVQKDRLEVSIVEWGDGEEAWVMDHIIIPGDTAQPHVWGHLGAELDDWGLDAAAVDSGYNTSMVYAFAERRRWAYAIKGRPGPGRPLVEDERTRRQRLRQQRRKGIAVHLIGDDQAKALIYARLKLTKPGPGYIHWPMMPSFDDEYFAQIASEKLVARMRGTRPIYQWEQVRPRNEALDCLKYALAALRLGVDMTRVSRRPRRPIQREMPTGVPGVPSVPSVPDDSPAPAFNLRAAIEAAKRASIRV